MQSYHYIKKAIICPVCNKKADAKTRSKDGWLFSHKKRLDSAAVDHHNRKMYETLHCEYKVTAVQASAKPKE